MSLRVLLADESSTIKKVMQLALQDFDVEVKAVPVGLDVLEVTRAFMPDLIFADVLLSKRNGYEVSAELKADAGLKSIPIILMWSGFMELDEAKAKLSKADRRLEKPFDADTLRNMVRELVPKTQTSLISQFLTFPNLPEIEETPAKAPPLPPTPAAPKAATPPVVETMDFEEPEDFQNVPLPKLPENSIPKRAPVESELWAQQDLGKFMIPVSEEDLSPSYDYSPTDMTKSSIALSSGFEEISLEDFSKESKPSLPPMPGAGPSKKLIEAQMEQDRQDLASPSVAPGTNLPSMTTISHERMEQVLREQVREVLEGIAWKVLPDLAERVIREEIQKLMKDSENL